MEYTTVREQENRKHTAFVVGDAVVYRAEGVCDIVDIRKEAFGTLADGEEYYILSPRNDANSSIYVPVHNERLTALMRPIVTRDELAGMVKELCEVRLEWLSESRARNNAFREILSLGDRRALIVLVLTVKERIEQTVAMGKKPGSTETGALSRACKLLRDEISLVTPLHSDEELIALLRGEREI